MKIMRAMLFTLVFAVTGSGCGSSDVGPAGRLVGGTCDNSSQCDFLCHNEAHYPGGYCTVRCNSDAECPASSGCVDENGGICAALCKVPADCAAWGRGYTCDNVNRRGGGGDHNVCRVD